MLTKLWLSQSKFVEMLRWVTSIGFSFLAMSKGMLLWKYGFEPYELVVAAAGLPGVISYYGLVAVVIELYLVIGLWVKFQYSRAVWCTIALTLGGVVLSISFIMFKINSDCGCGFLGDNEWLLLIQKLVILIVLIVLLKMKSHLQF